MKLFASILACLALPLSAEEWRDQDLPRHLRIISEQDFERYARTHGPSIRADGRRRVLAGDTTLEEVLRVTRED